MTAPTVLQEAQEIIYGDREQTYGHPAKNLLQIANLWTAFLQSKGANEGIVISASDVAMMMMLVKMARQQNNFKRDNIVDMCGYAALLARIEEP
jgi:L-lactate permease